MPFQAPSAPNWSPNHRPLLLSKNPNDGIEDHEPEEEEFVSAAEHFIAADEDGSGALDVEELARATGNFYRRSKRNSMPRLIQTVTGLSRTL